MKLFKRVFLVFLTPCLSICSCFAQINTESIEAYFKITDSVKAGKEISESAWDAFFRMKGNAFFLEKYHPTADKLKKRFRRSVLQIYGNGGKNKPDAGRDLFMRSILYLNKHEEEVRTYIRQICSSCLIDSGYQQAYRYLPKRMRQPVPNLSVYLVAPIVPNSLSAKDDNSIYLNTALEHMMSKARFGAMEAHELHHLLLKLPSFKSRPVWNQFDAVSLLSWVSREGVADLIDKKYLTLLADPLLYENGKKGMQEAAHLVVSLNNIISQLSKSANQRAPLNSPQLEGITGHAPGFYMASIIERNGFLPELLGNVDRPARFALIYNKAALVDPSSPPLFSRKSLDFLKEIDAENAYSPDPGLLDYYAHFSLWGVSL